MAGCSTTAQRCKDSMHNTHLPELCVAAAQLLQAHSVAWRQYNKYCLDRIRHIIWEYFELLCT